MANVFKKLQKLDDICVVAYYKFSRLLNLCLDLIKGQKRLPRVSCKDKAWLKDEMVLASAAIVESRREPCDALVLRTLDYNRKPRPTSPAIVAPRKRNGNLLKENEDPNFAKNPYQAIVMARDSLKQREETTKMQAEIQKLDDEVNEVKLKNEEEKLSIQDLELAFIDNTSPFY